MAPSKKELEEALIAATCSVFAADPETTTVNKVRKQAEGDNDLEDGFFRSEQWKGRSKELITEYVDKLMNGWKPDSKASKRPSDDAASPEPKRRKKSAPKKTPKSKVAKEDAKPKKKAGRPQKKIVDSEDEESDMDLDDEEEEEDVVKPHTKIARRKKVVDDDEEEADEPSTKPKPAPRQLKSKAASHIEDSEDDMEQGSPPAEDKDTAKEENETKKTADSDNESEMSVLIDEEPTTAKRRGSKSQSAPKEKKPKKEAKKSAPKASDTADDPDTAEIKKLQGHLVKCGVRKLWHNELKSYGDNSRAKIKHLRGMLDDVGMTGRFSEAKAREIKERRELLADLESAQEMNKLWGSSRGARSSRAKAKSMREDKDSDAEEQGKSHDEKSGADEEDAGEEEEEEEEEAEEQSFAARKRRAQADLAFLGDDSDSD